MHRRRFLAATATVAAVTAGCGGRSGSDDDAGQQGEATWPSAAHDAANARHAPGSALPAEPTVNWRATVPSAEQYPPVVTESRVFALGRDGLYAFDRSGTEQWSVALDDDVYPPPPTAVDDRWVALVTDEGWLRLFDADDGHVVFERTFEGGVDAAVVAPARRRELYVTTDRGRLHALRLTGDGWERRWRHDAFGGVDQAPAVVDGAVVATTAGVERLTRGGVGRWRTGLPAPTVTRPVVDGGRVIVGCEDETVHALDVETGGHLWSRDVTRNERIMERFGAIAATPDHVFVTRSRTVWALDPATGRPQWRHGDIEESFGRPVVVDNALLVTGRESLLAVERDGGVGVGPFRLDPVRWRHSLDVSPRGLAVAGDSAYLLGAAEGSDRLLEFG